MLKEKNSYSVFCWARKKITKKIYRISIVWLVPNIKWIICGITANIWKIIYFWVKKGNRDKTILCCARLKKKNKKCLAKKKMTKKLNGLSTARTVKKRLLVNNISKNTVNSIKIKLTQVEWKTLKKNNRIKKITKKYCEKINCAKLKFTCYIGEHYK